MPPSPFRSLRVVLVCLLLATVGRAETLRLRADSWMPYNGDDSAALPGYAIEIARKICASHGVTLDYQTMPWGDALKAAAAGEIEAVVGANRDETKGLVRPQHSIGMPRIALVVRKGNPWHYENVASLHHVRLGVVLDYKYWPAVDDYIAKTGAPHVQKFGGDHPLNDAIDRLLAGDLDVVAETSTVFAWAIKSAGHPSAAFHTAYLHEGDPVYFAFTPKGDVGARYARWFDEGIESLRASGELKRILARYGLTDWEE